MRTDGSESRPYPAKLRLLAATRLAGDEVSGTGEDILLGGFFGRGGGEELEGFEIIGLHHGVMRGRGAATSEEEDREEQSQLGDEGRQVTDDALGTADITGGRVTDELGAAADQDHRQEDREGEEHPAHQAITLGGAVEDFGSGGRRGAGHDRGKD